MLRQHELNPLEGNIICGCYESYISRKDEIQDTTVFFNKNVLGDIQIHLSLSISKVGD